MGESLVGLITNRFNELRTKFGNILLQLKKNKIPVTDWYKYISKQLTEEELAFIHGINVNKYLKNALNIDVKGFILIDLCKGSRLEIEENSSRLIISKEKAGIIAWISTDGYLEVKKNGYYIRIRDEDPNSLPYFKSLINSVYGNVHIGFRKIKNKNAFEATISSKNIVSDILTYIPLHSTLNWTIPFQLLDKTSLVEFLKIVTFAEGSAFISRRTREIEITSANFDILIQIKAAFEVFGIETSEVRKDFSGGWKRYKFFISRRYNLEKFRNYINFVPNTEKFCKFEKIMHGYKAFHRSNTINEIIEIIKNNPNVLTKDIKKIGNFDRSTLSRNLKKLMKLEAIDYKKGRGNQKFWYLKFI